MKKRGFTILELLITLSIIGVLTAIIVPIVTGLISNAENTVNYGDAERAYANYLIGTTNKIDKEELILVKEGKNVDQTTSPISKNKQTNHGVGLIFDPIRFDGWNQATLYEIGYKPTYLGKFDNYYFWKKNNGYIPVDKYGNLDTSDENYEYVIHGRYPQSAKKNNVQLNMKVTMTMGSYEYVLGSDYNWYTQIDVLWREYIGGKVLLSNGDFFEDNVEYWFKLEPLIHKVVFQDEEELTLFPTTLIHQGLYYPVDTKVKYEDSIVRDFLNNEYLYSGFTSKEMTIINKTTITSSTKGNDELHDYIYIPSLEEISSSEYGYKDIEVFDPARVLNKSDYFLTTMYIHETIVIDGIIDVGSRAWLRDDTYHQRPYMYYERTTGFIMAGADLEASYIPCMRIKL